MPKNVSQNIRHPSKSMSKMNDGVAVRQINIKHLFKEEENKEIHPQRSSGHCLPKQ